MEYFEWLIDEHPDEEFPRVKANDDVRVFTNDPFLNELEDQIQKTGRVDMETVLAALPAEDKHFFSKQGELEFNDRYDDGGEVGG